jgi:hypothetical protein
MRDKKPVNIKNSSKIPKTEITEYIAGAQFPMTKSELIDYASQQNPPSVVLQALTELPMRLYHDELDVNHALNNT